MCDRLCDYWLSQRVDWHIERGLKLRSDGSCAGPNEKGVTLQNLAGLNQA